MQPIVNGNGNGNGPMRFPGKKPSIAAPRVSVNLNRNGNLNNFQNSVVQIKGKKPAITRPGNTPRANKNVKVNKTKLLDRLRKVEELLGYNRSGPAPTIPTGPAVTSRPAPTTNTGPAVTSRPAASAAPSASAASVPAPSVTVTVGNIGTTGSSRRRRRTPEPAQSGISGILRRQENRSSPPRSVGFFDATPGTGESGDVSNAGSVRS